MLDGRMSLQINYILRLVALLEQHHDVSHWALSYRLTGRGDQFDKLRKGSDILSGRAERLLLDIEKSWPVDLEWPSDVPKPSKARRLPPHQPKECAS